MSLDNVLSVVLIIFMISMVFAFIGMGIEAFRLDKRTKDFDRKFIQAIMSRNKTHLSVVENKKEK